MHDFPALIQFKLKPYKDTYVLGCNTTFMVTVSPIPEPEDKNRH